MVLILDHSLQGLQGALEYAPWVCLGFGDLGCCTEAYGWKKSAANWRSRKTKDPETWLTIIKSKFKCCEHQDVDQNGRQGLPPSEDSNVPSSLVRLIMGMKQCMWQCMYWYVFLSRKERLSPAQISNIFLVLKSCLSLHFLSGLRKSTFVEVISQITQPDMGKNMEGHFERDNSLG